MKRLAFLLLFLPLQSLADEGFSGFGIGPSQAQVFEIGLREEVWEGFYFQYQGGYWKENSEDLTKKSGLFASTALGLGLNLNRFEIRGSLGLTLISSPNSQIEGYFPKLDMQFYTGVRAKSGEGIGFQGESVDGYRNFIILQISKQW